MAEQGISPDEFWGAAPQAAPAPTPATASPNTLPDGASVNLAAQRGVTFQNGAYADAQGNAYAPAADQGDGYFRDRSGGLFHTVPAATQAPAQATAKEGEGVSPDEFWGAPAPSMAPQASGFPARRGGPSAAPDWFAAQNASRNARYASVADQARAAPLPSIGDAIGGAFNDAARGLKTATGDWFQHRPPAPSLNPMDNPLTQAASVGDRYKPTCWVFTRIMGFDGLARPSSLLTYL